MTTYPNGKLPDSELWSIPDGGWLRHDAARAYTAMCNQMHAKGVAPPGVADSYRPLGHPGDLAKGIWSQWAAKERQLQGGNLAATPGQSNHGWGLAIDSEDPVDLERFGAPFGWQKRWSDAPSESWHYKFAADHADTSIVDRWYDRGPYKTHAKGAKQDGDTLALGDRGPGVAALARRLAFVPRVAGKPYLAQDDRASRFTRDIQHAVRLFQRHHKLTVDGVYGPGTHKRLLRDVEAEKARRAKGKA